MPLHKTVIMTRKELYDEIWDLSIQGVAYKYDLIYDPLFRQIRNEKIPRPDNSYLRRKKLGHDVSQEKIPLSGDPDKKMHLASNQLIRVDELEESVRAEQRSNLLHQPEYLRYLEKDERETLAKQLEFLYPDVNADVSDCVLDYISKNSNSFSENGKLRATYLLNTVANAMSDLGAEVSVDNFTLFFMLQFHGAEVSIRMRERKSKRRIAERNEADHDRPRTMEVFNGRLEMMIDDIPLSDETGYPLEFKTTTILLTILEAMEHRVVSANSVDSAEDIVRQKELEELIQKARAYHNAALIREYVAALEARRQGENEESNDHFVDWAKEALAIANEIDSAIDLS